MHEKHVWFSLYTGNLKTGTLASSEDPEEMQHNAREYARGDFGEIVPQEPPFHP